VKPQFNRDVKKYNNNKMNKFKVFIIYISIHSSVAVYMSRAGSCQDVECRPGRECKQLTRERHVCSCRENCPQNWKPVCGSDGNSYDNHCFLHKAACDSKTHISPLHSGFCRGDREAVIARQEFIQQLALWDQEEPTDKQKVFKKVPLPDACFENDRNRLREFLISWASLSAKKQPWYTSGMTSGEELWGHFYSADQDRDLALDTREWVDYLRNNDTDVGKKSHKMRQLCITELIHEGDNDKDDKLDFDEFREILNDDYTPSSQVCDFDGLKFVDGAERALECNGCVCACGKWICTSEICTEGYRDIENRIDNDYDDIDEVDEDPEDDPDVQNIKWF